MKFLISIVASLMATGSVVAQTFYRPTQCSRDSLGNQVCIGTQPDANVCGTAHVMFFGYRTLYCDDVVVQKTAADGQIVYTRVLGGESDEVPRQFVFDAQNNVILLGTTYSRVFPVTAGAIQSGYAGPQPPAATYSTPLFLGGDLFLSVLSPSGNLLYSTFLGSSGNDTILGVRDAGNGQFDVLVAAGGSNF